MINVEYQNYVGTYLKTFDGIMRSRVLNIREPSHEALQKLPQTLWESVVYEVKISLRDWSAIGVVDDYSNDGIVGESPPLGKMICRTG